MDLKRDEVIVSLILLGILILVVFGSVFFGT